ncbi:MAG: SusD/RagB family nutrient-binding outer membrane lipoprotein [Longimicrobiaceae bacterium]
MRNLTHGVGRALGAAVLAASLGACGGFINDVPGNENVVQNASVGQLFTSIQLNTWLLNEGHLSRLSSLWTNQMAGIDRQFSSLDKYIFGEDETDEEMSQLYPGGGLEDIRLARARADSNSLSHTSAVLKIHEAFLFGMGASIWGDLPYSGALGGAAAPQSPVDPQEAVYAAVQTLLDQAITALAAAPSASDAALLSDRDMSFGGNAVAWRQVANSLKARLYMHWVEAQAAGGASATAANTACAGNCVTKALAAAQQGINTSANNWMSVHSTASTEANWWNQFSSERSGYAAAGALMVDSMKARTDPRLDIYFAGPSSIGSKPGQDNGAATPLNTGSGGIAAPENGLPLISCAETQFIIAEAQYRLGATAAANTALQNGIVCQEAHFGVNIPNPPALAGAALFHEIMMQKYFALFLNMEAWNDYKRTCEPNIAAGVKVGGSLATKPIPARVFYGESERQSNSNLSTPGSGNNGLRNRNDPVSCVTVTGLLGA